MSKRSYTFVPMNTQDYIILSIALVLLGYTVYTHVHFNNILKLLKQQPPMANFTDLQTASQALTAAATALETAASAYVTSHATDITATQADTIVADINTATASLRAATDSLTPAA